jgi:flavin-dependent dehydrogenase
MSDAVDRKLQKKNTAEASPDQYDVVIVGGGMAGLTQALQLKKMRPTIRILVVEKQKHPVPESAHKVGESTVEVAAHYLRNVLGLEEHLQTQQLRKFGLRMFFSSDDNQDITQRVEYGQTGPAPLHTYQLDRGRLENTLGNEIQKQGIVFLDGCKVKRIVLQPDSHRLHLLHENSQREVRACWVVDASGRSSLLKRQLGLAKKVEHNANAAWFRIGHPIDINTWSDNPDWLARINEGERSLSTNHLMGPGYWVWLIRLPSDSISIGIVTDATMHPFEGINRFERALAWLHSHEPQCAAIIEQHRADVQDFHVLKNYAYTCQQVYSSERWCLTGEAAVSIDPLYSAGGDLIAISNGLICDLITRDLDGEDIQGRAAFHDKLFLILTDIWLTAYQQQYTLMGNAQVMVTKLIWDTAIYWAVPGLLHFHDKFRSLVESPGVVANVFRFSSLHNRVQAFFREWHAIDQPAISSTFVDPYSMLNYLLELHLGMAAGLTDAELEVQFAANACFLERLAGQIVSTVMEAYADQVENEAVQSQLQLWQSEPFLAGLVSLYQQEDPSDLIDSDWITLARRSQSEQEIVI